MEEVEIYLDVTQDVIDLTQDGIHNEYIYKNFVLCLYFIFKLQNPFEFMNCDCYQILTI